MDSWKLWVYLQATPLFWLTATLAAFFVADLLAQKAKRRPLVNPVLIAVILVAGLLKLSHTDYRPISTAPSSCISCSGRRPSRWPCRSTAISNW